VAAPAIEVEGVGKRYRLGRGYGEDGGISHRLDAMMRKPFRLLSRGRKHLVPAELGEEFWALRDVSFKVEQGEVIGFIGANGAGKSTLLKLLSRVTYPTEGRITLRGTTGSLLEVGTGFHPELTGRENVFLNGTILGMRRREIIERYDEIVEFSGIEQFIETPVKRYSSGMMVRLGFAVAAHLNPDVLIVDEVLAVGDAEFQRKCIGKIEDVAEQGRTIVFVSHNMGSVRALCERVLLIEHGRITAEGPADRVVADYLDRVQPVQHGGVSMISDQAPRVGTGEAKVKRVSLHDDSGGLIEQVLFGQPFTVAAEIEVSRELPAAVFAVGISKDEEGRVLTANSTDRGGSSDRLAPGRFEVRARLETTLLPGEFVVDIAIVDPAGQTIDYVERVISFSARNYALEGDDSYPWQTVTGYVRPESDWTVSATAPRTEPERAGR
jgi:lipopolysaccharide transport system ATP-binding protein